MHFRSSEVLRFSISHVSLLHFVACFSPLSFPCFSSPARSISPQGHTRLDRRRIERSSSSVSRSEEQIERFFFCRRFINLDLFQNGLRLLLGPAPTLRGPRPPSPATQRRTRRRSAPRHVRSPRRHLLQGPRPLPPLGRRRFHLVWPRSIFSEDDGAVDVGLLSGLHRLCLRKRLSPCVREDELLRAEEGLKRL